MTNTERLTNAVLARHGLSTMGYDEWKTESPEDERARWDRVAARKLARYQWLEEHADQLNEERRERRLERD